MDERVSKIMTTGVVTISLDEKLDLVDEIMSSGDIRHMPVTKGGFVVGLVTQRDLLRAKLSSGINFSKEDRKELLEATDVEKVMVKDVKLADPNEPVVHAAKRMLEMRIGCLPVVNNDRELLGIITEIDVMRYFVEIAEGNDS
ncbi:MAG: CBS domain-containing protein [Nitrospinota bacterium]